MRTPKIKINLLPPQQLSTKGPRKPSVMSRVWVGSSDVGVWKSIFGWRTLSRWDVQGAIVPGIFLAVGIGMLGVDWFPHNLVISQVCFGIAGALVLLKALVHAIETPGPIASQAFFVLVMFTVTILGSAWIVQTIQVHKDKREVKVETEPKQNPRITTPPPQPQTITSTATLDVKPAAKKPKSSSVTTAPTHHVGEGFIQIYPTVNDVSTLLQENEKVVFVANYSNKGQEPVNEFVPFASLIPIGEGTDLPDISRDAVWDRFHQERREYESKHPNRKGDSVGPGDNWQITVDSTQVLNRAAIDAIRSGKIKILLVALAEWRTVSGIKGEIESCFVLVPPEQKNPALLPWSSCGSL